MRYCARAISKVFWRSKFVFSFWTHSRNHFCDCQIFLEVFLFSGPSPDHFWSFSSKTFLRFSKNWVGSLRNPFLDVIIITFSTSYFTSKIWILQEPKEKFRWNKNHFSSILGAFILVKCKITANTSFEYEQRWKVIISFVTEL